MNAEVLSLYMEPDDDNTYGPLVGHIALIQIVAAVSNHRGWVIMTNAEKDRFNPIIKAIAEECGWLRPGKGAWER